MQTAGQTFIIKMTVLTFLLLIALPVTTTPLPEVECAPCPSGCMCTPAGNGSCQVICYDLTMGVLPPRELMPHSVIKMSFHNCSIKEIPASYFESFPNLQYLDFSTNVLTSLPNGVFARHSDLQYLFLTGNPIKDLPLDVFRNLVALKTLSLENTALSNLEESSIMPMKNLQKLYVANNPWHCSCQLLWLGAWLKSHGNLADVSCASPSNLEGQPLVHLSKFLQNCGDDSGEETDSYTTFNITEADTFRSRRSLASSVDNLPKDVKCDPASISSCIITTGIGLNQSSSGSAKVVLSSSHGVQRAVDCQDVCLQNDQDVFIYVSGSNCCVCGSVTQDRCNCDSNPPPARCQYYISGSFVTSIPVFITELSPTSTEEVLTINVTSSPNPLEYWTSVDNVTRPVNGSVITYKFPSPGRHNMSINEVNSTKKMFPVLVEDPVVSAKVLASSRNYISVEVPQGSNVHITWKVLSKNNGWILYDKRCILVEKTPKTSAEAVTHCNSLNASLLVVRDHGQLNQLTKLVDDKKYLIGAQFVSNEWQWVINGEETYFNEKRDKFFSNSANLRCMSSKEGTLEPVSCATSLPFICEKEKMEQSSAPQQVSCKQDEYYHIEENRCYSLVSVRKNWTEANELCGKMGGELASIKEVSLLQDLEDNLLKSQMKHYVWLGLQAFGGLNLWTEDFSSHKSVPTWSSSRTVFPDNYCMVLVYDGKWSMTGQPCRHFASAALCSYRAGGELIEQVPVFNVGAKDIFGPMDLEMHSSQTSQYTGPTTLTLFPSYSFLQEGILQHWMFETSDITADTELHLQVFQVECKDGEYIRPPGCNGDLSSVAKCAMSSPSCDSAPSCPSSMEYCPWSKKCQPLYEECSCSCNVPNTVASLYGASVPKFTLVGETVVVLEPQHSRKSMLVKAGNITVKKNYILAVQQEQAVSALKCEMKNHSVAISSAINSWLRPGTQATALSGTDIVLAKRCQLQAMYTQPVTVTLKPDKPKINSQTSTVYEITLKNHVSTYKLQREISNLEPVTGFKLHLPAPKLDPANKFFMAVEAGKSVMFTWTITTGSEAEFSWSVPGSQNVSFTDQCKGMSNCASLPDQFVHVSYNALYQLEPYEIVAKAFNKISNAAINISVYVQVPVSGLKINCPKLWKIGETGHTIEATTVTGSHLTYEWTLNDIRVTSSSRTFDTSFLSAAGVYLITVRCYNLLSEGTTNATVEVYIPAKPRNLGLMLDNVHVEQNKKFDINLAVSATMESKVTFIIDFKDGSPVENRTESLSGKTSAMLIINHSYSNTGSYSIVVWAVDANLLETASLAELQPSGDATSKTQTVTVEPLLTDFNLTSSAVSIATGDSVTFTVIFPQKTVTGTFSYEWSFGDGQSAKTLRQGFVRHKFAPSGVYSVSVIVSNNVVSKTKKLLQTVQDSISNLQVTVKRPVYKDIQVTLQASVSKGTNITVFKFNSGMSGATSHTSSSNSYTHVYPREGQYNATVLASNKVSTVTAWTVINVYNSSAFAIEAIDGPLCEAVAAKTSFSVIAVSSNQKNLEYQWSVDGIVKAAGVNISTFQYSFPATGIYAVNATITDGSRSASASKTVCVQEIISGVVMKPDRTILALKENSSTSVTFNISVAQGSNYTFQWSAGGHITNSIAGPSHVIEFNKPGDKTVGLTVINELGSVKTDVVIQVQQVVSDVKLEINGNTNVSYVSSQKSSNFSLVYRTGTHLQYGWFFHQSIANFTVKIISVKFPTTGPLNIIGYVSNNVSNATVRHVLHVIDPVVPISLSSSKTIVAVNETVNLTLIMANPSAGTYQWEACNNSKCVALHCTTPVCSSAMMSSGIYQVKVRVQNPVSVATKTILLTVLPRIKDLEIIPGTAFKASNKLGSYLVQGEKLVLTGSVSDSLGAQFSWNVTDNSNISIFQTTGKSLNYVFSTVGSYTVTLSVNNKIDIASTSKAIIIQETIKRLYMAPFISDSCEVGRTLCYEARYAAGTDVTYLWEVKESSNIQFTSADRKLNYRPAKAGYYTVKLLAENMVSKAAYETRVLVDVAIEANAIVVDPGSSSNVLVNHPVRLAVNSISADLQYIWTFFDTTPPREQSGSSVTHHFQTTGTYIVEVTISNGFRKVDLSKEIIVYPEVKKLAVVSNVTAVATGEAVKFEAVVMDCEVSHIKWYVDDMETDVGSQFFTHSFQSAGTSQVSASCASRKNADSDKVNITVEDEVKDLQLSCCDQVVAVNVLQYFNASLTQGSNVEFKWTLSDSSIIRSLLALITHKFYLPGKFSVEVEASNKVSRLKVHRLITVQDPITSVTIMALDNVFVGQNFDVYAIADGGSDLTYTWRLNFNVFNTTNSPATPLVVQSAGNMLLTVTAQNNISKTTDTKLIKATLVQCDQPDIEPPVGGINQTVMRSSVIQIETKVSTNDCTRYQVEHQWSLYSNTCAQSLGQQIDLGDKAFVKSPVLVIQPRTLQYGQYCAEIKAGYYATPMESKYYVDINVVPSGPIAIIAGGSERTFSSSDDIVLDGTESYDPDTEDGKNPLFTYHWNCTSQTPGMCFEDASTERVTVPQSVLVSDTEMMVNLEVSVKGREVEIRNGSAKLHVKIKPPTVTRVKIECLSCRESNIYTMGSSRPIKLLGSCTNCGPDVRYEWSVYDENNNHIHLTDVNSTTGLHGRNLAIASNVLDSRKGHNFRLTAWSDRHTNSGYASLDLKANEPPKGGTCTLTVGNTSNVMKWTPISVIALTDLVDITCKDWKDPDDPLESPLIHHMYVQRASLLGLITGEWYPLYRGTQSSGSFYLSQWQQDQYIFVRVDVIDAMGAVTDGFGGPVTLEVTAPDPETIRDETTALLVKLFMQNDPKIIRQYCLALAIQLNFFNDVPGQHEEIVELKGQALMIAHSTLESTYSIDDAQQFIYILQDFTDSFELPDDNNTYVMILDILDTVTNTLSFNANPSTDGDNFLPKQLIETVGNMIQVDGGTDSYSVLTGIHPTSMSSFVIEYLDVAHMVMVLYSLTQISGERPFEFNTGNLNSMGVKSILKDIPLDQEFMNISISLPHIENIGMSIREVFQSVVMLTSNPFDWGYSHPITSQVCSLSFYNTNGSKIDVLGLTDEDGLIELGLPASPDHPKAFVDPYNVTLLPGQTLTTSFNLTGQEAAHITVGVITLELETPSESHPSRSAPQHGIHPPEGAVVAYLSEQTEPLYDRYSKMLFVQDSSEISDNNTFFISAREVQANTQYHMTLTNSDTKRSVNVTVSLFYSQCLFYNEATNKWDNYGCYVTDKSSATRTTCRCSHLTLFGSSVYHSSVNLDFKELQRLSVTENPVAIIIVSVIAGIYLIALIWGRWRDKQAHRLAEVIPLCGKDGVFKYEINIITGRYLSAGTSAHVGIIVHGTDSRSSPRHLTKDGAFQRNGDDTFMVATDHCLGDITKVKLWHDNTGMSPSWFVHRVIIKDLHSGKSYCFHFDKWLSLENKKGAIEYEVAVSAEEDLLKFENHFRDQTCRGFADGHMWLSLVNRPPKSRFTHVQRLSCCVTLLYCFMMMNVIWYGVLTAQPSELDYALGHIAPDWQDLLAGALASLLAFPPVYVLTIIFKKTRSKPKVRDFDEKSDTAQTIEIDAYCDMSSAAGSSFISRSSRGPPSDGQLRRSVSDVVRKSQKGLVGRLRRTGALRKLFRVDSLDDMTDTSSAISGFTNNNTIKDDLARQIPGTNKPLYSKDGIMEWHNEPVKWLDMTSSAGKHRRAVSNTSEDSVPSVSGADDVPRGPERNHPRIVLRRPTAQTVYLEASIDEREEDTYVSPVPPRRHKKDQKEEAIPMKTFTVDKTVQTETRSNVSRNNSAGSSTNSDLTVPTRRRRRGSHHVRPSPPEPILEHHVSDNPEAFVSFVPKREDTLVQAAIQDIEANMGERPPVKSPRKPRKHHSGNTGRGHRREASNTSNDSYESRRSNSSDKSGHVNVAFVPDEEMKTHRRQESGISFASEVSDISVANAIPLHKTKSSKISRRWETIVIPEDLGYSDASRSGRYESDDSGSWVPPPVHHLTHTSTMVGNYHQEAAERASNSGVTLPHYFKYLAYVLCLALSVFSVIVTLLYSNSFGLNMALKWLLAFIASFLGSVLVIEPLKVILIALVTSMFSTSYSHENVMVRVPMLQMSETIKDVRIKPVGGFALMQAREETRKIQRMRLLLRQLAAYFLFLWVMIVLCYTTINLDITYQLNQAAQMKYNWSATAEDLKDHMSWYDCTLQDIVQQLHSPKDDNFQLYLVGIPRLRQIRAKIGPCPLPFIQSQSQESGEPDRLRGCRTKDEDTRSYLESWLKLKHPTNYTWVFTPPKEALGVKYAGKTDKFHGGGYLVNLASSLPASRNIILVMKLQNWIDRGTKAVFIEATFYYPPTNTFTSVVLATEFPLAGGSFYTSSVRSIVLIPWRIDSLTVFVVLLGVVSIYLILHTLSQIVKLRRKYFLQFWNCFEFLMLTLTIFSMVAYALKIIEDSEKIAEITKRERKYISLEKNFDADSRWRTINASIMFMLTIWIVKQMRFIKCWSIYGNTLKGSAPFLLGLAFIMTLIFLMYAQLGYLWYGTVTESFSSLASTFCNLFVLVRGTFTDLDNMLEYDALFTQVYVFSFMSVTLIFVMCLAVAILNSTYQTLKEQAHYYNNMDVKDYEMIEFTLRRFKRWLGLTKEKPAFRRVKFQGLPSGSTVSSLKSGVAPGSSGSTGSSGMSDVMDLLEAESQAYLDGLLDRAPQTWNNMLHQLTLLEEVDSLEKEQERDVYKKLLQVRIRGMRPDQEKMENSEVHQQTLAEKFIQAHNMPTESGTTKPSEIETTRKGSLQESIEFSGGHYASKTSRRFSEQITSKSNTHKVYPAGARANSELGFKSKSAEKSDLSKPPLSGTAKPAW